MQKKDIIAFIVPTGIGANIGGFAGDASLYARMFSKYFQVIVNPNVVNAACFSGINDSMLYVEGFALNKFFQDKLHLYPSHNNKIGVIFDKGIKQEIINVHINTINAIKTVYGIDIVEPIITDENVNVEFFISKYNISSGKIKNPETLKNAGLKLLKNYKVDTIAVVCKFEDTDKEEDSDYKNGNGVDIVGGIEAVISHYLSRELNIPVVHAPAFEDIEIDTQIVDKKAAAEYITPTFLPCLLFGLNNAPLFLPTKYTKDQISIKDVKALVIPNGCYGSSIIFDSIKQNIPIFSIENNKTVIDLNISDLNISEKIIKVKTYEECLDKLLKLLK